MAVGYGETDGGTLGYGDSVGTLDGKYVIVGDVVGNVLMNPSPSLLFKFELFAVSEFKPPKPIPAPVDTATTDEIPIPIATLVATVVPAINAATPETVPNAVAEETPAAPAAPANPVDADATAEDAFDAAWTAIFCITWTL